MRFPLAALWLFALLPACAAPARFVVPSDDREVAMRDMVADLARNDVVVLGETHDNIHGHRAHLAIVQALHAERPRLAIAMEMFERDVQSVLYQYLLGDIEEAEFLRDSRPWPNYQTDYRPLVEWAKQNGVPVIAANVPRRLASKVAKEGLAAVAGDPLTAREVSAPEDLYWEAFKAEMGSHMGAGGDATRRFYEAQCLKDDTMAESIADFLKDERRQGRDTLVVHLCGRFHSDHRRGTVARVQSRLPEARIAVLTVDEVPESHEGRFTVKPGVADYVVVVPPMPKKETPARPAPPVAGKPVNPHEPRTGATPANPHEPKPATTAKATEPQREPPPPGARPALGLMPDYGAEGGMRVGGVTEGGPAWVGGVKEGDVIVKVAGLPVTDITTYSQALETVKVGELIEIVVKRGAENHTLKVEVGVRTR